MRYYIKNSVNDPQNSYNVMDSQRTNSEGRPFCVAVDLSREEAIYTCNDLNNYKKEQR